MKTSPRVGVIHERTFRIESQHLIDFAQDGMPAVLCTPALIGFLEQTAREALAQHLQSAENSVGLEIEITHLAPTPPGMNVTCRARIIHVEDRKVTFQIEARDEQELIARGLHQRQVIHTERFAKLVRKKERAEQQPPA